ncbi:MAG: hypothetical protein JSS04_01155 [Proteobacteria bacterium]|nr:hypothetical protein [Pseudomonadota bacterium]
MTIVVGIAAVLMTAVVLRLLSGPVDLEVARPFLPTEFDTPAGPVKVRAEHIYVEWSGLKEPMRLVLTGLHMMDASDHELASAPGIAVAFDPRSVVNGRLRPVSIVVNRPNLEADIAREGGMLQRVLASSDPDSQAEVVDLLIEQLLSEHNDNSVLGQLNTIDVVHARVSLRDVPSGVVWVAPDVQGRLNRDAAGVKISAKATFLGPKSGEPIDVSLDGTYSRDRSRISFEAAIDGMKPSMLADLSPDTVLLRGLDIALSGRLEVEASGSGEVRTVSMEVTAGAGTITLPGVLPVTHKVRSVNALAHVDAAAHTARIDHIDVDMGVAKIAVTGTGQRTQQGQTFTGKAEVKNIPIDKLGDYWPLEFAEGGRAWALANLSGGSLDIGADFTLSTPGNDLSRLSVDRNVAYLAYRGMTVHYMPHMPELLNVSGNARFEGDTMRFDVAGGNAVGLAVTGATIELTGLDGPSPQQYASLRVPISGPAPAVEALLARPKLGLPRDALYDPKRLGGDVAIDLTLSFPLLNALTVSDIDIKAEAAVSAFSLKSAIGNVDLSDGVGRLVYANSQLNVTGVGKFDGNAVDIVWREQFGPRAPYRQRYELRGTIPASLLAKAGFPSPEPYISGPVNVTGFSYQVATNGAAEIQGKLDLKGAKLAAPVGWSKDAGTDGHLTLGMKLAPGGKLSTADFEAQANGLRTKGQVRFGPDNSVQEVAVSELALGGTNISAEWRRNAAGSVEVALRGPSLELSRVRAMLKAREDVAQANPGGPASRAQESTRFLLQVDRVVLQRGSIGSLNGKLELNGDRMVSADLGIGSGKGATLKVTPGAKGRDVNLYVADFGELLRQTGWLDGLSGGYLDFRGRVDDSVGAAPLIGRLKLGPYSLQKVTPRPGIGTLNTTIETLNRAGDPLQQFDALETQVVKTGDRIELKDGHTASNSIGLTTGGVIDLASDRAHLRGIVVPGFVLNNLLSNVPLLGPLLTGGKNGGVFAIAYRLDGPLDDLKTDINMMSAVTPGALRELFTRAPYDGRTSSESPLDRSP